MISKMEMICYHHQEKLVDTIRRTCIFVQACLREKFEEFQFPQSSNTEKCMVERQDFLNRNLATSGLVQSSCDGTISTFSDGV
jgi:hypothetical protein